MATSTLKRKKLAFQLPLKVSSEMLQELKPDCLRAICKSFSEEVPLLNTRFGITEKIPCITIKSICYTDEQIIFTFEVETKEELTQFYKACKSKTLSDILCDFADSCGFHLKTDLKINDRLILSMDMEEAEYYKYMSFLCKNESGEDLENSNVAKAVTRTVVQTSKESQQPIMDASLANHAQDVKMCGLDFYLHLAVVNVVGVKLQSSCEEINQVKLEAVPGHDCLWGVHIEVPEIKLKQDISYKYKYKVHSSILFFLGLKSFETVTRSLHSTVQRDDVGALTLEGYLAHCYHIFDICQTMDGFECVRQFQTMCLPQCTFEQKCHIVEIIKPIVSVSKRNSVIVFTIMLMNIFQNIRQFLETNIITKEMVRTLLEMFKTENPVNYSDSCHQSLYHLLSNFCKFLYERDYCLLFFIYEIYPFFDERFFSQKIIDLFSRKKPLCSADLADMEYLRVILSVAEQRISPDRESDVAVFLERLFRHLPLFQALRGYSYFCKSSVGGHPKIQEKLLLTLQASSMADIYRTVIAGSFKHLVLLWELIKEEQNLLTYLTDRLQKAIVSFVTNSRAELTMDDSKTLYKLFVDSHLFHDEQSQEQLLKAVGQSKVKNLHEIFTNLLWDFKNSDCLQRNPDLLLEWLKTAIRYHVKDANYSSIEDEICPCYAYLHDALAVPVLQQGDPLQTKLEEYVFKWLKQIDLKKALRKLEDIEKLNTQKPMVLGLYQRHLQQLLADHCHSSKPEDLLIEVCGTSGHLRVNTRYTAELVQKMMELFCNTFENDQYENFINMTKISKFWILILNMEGTHSVSTKNHEIFKKGMLCLEFIVKSLESKNITCSQLEKIKKVQDTKELLVAAGKLSKMDIDKLWKNVISVVQREKDKVDCAMKVLHKIREVVPLSCLPPGWNSFEERINKIDKKLKGHKITTGCVMDGTQIWSYCKTLPEICERLVGYIDSQVFWNACLDILLNEHELTGQEESFLEEDVDSEVLGEEKETLILESLKYLFCESVHEIVTISSCISFLKVLVHHGGLKYREDWMMFCKNPVVTMRHVVKMFEKADILQEISLCEQTLKLHIDAHNENALRLYHDFDKYCEQVEVIKMALNALGIDSKYDQTFAVAIDAFDKIMTHTADKITLDQVHKALKTISKIALDLKEEKLQVLRALGKAGTLVELLKEVDVDFRSLIDAVEEVSEQSVNEATVLGLIDVKRFLQPVLKKDMKSNIAHLFQIISKQMKDIKPNELAGKILDCRNNVYNLRSLYNNVANRGVRTKEIVDNVIKSGAFCFQLDTGDECVLSVGYQHGKKTEHHGKDTLIDM